MKTYLADTNVILRFLTGEPKELAEKARDLIKETEEGLSIVRILPMVVAEAVFVLSGKYYNLERSDISEALIQFLETPNFDVVNRDVLIEALRVFKQHNIDYADAYLAAEALKTGYTVASFDRDFRKINGLKLQEL